MVLSEARSEHEETLDSTEMDSKGLDTWLPL